jgi:hypothetical protein
LLAERQFITCLSERDFSKVIIVTSAVLLSLDEQFANDVFVTPLRFLEIGIGGAQVLVPIMLAVVANRATFNKQEVRFLCSLPLFRKDIAVPDVILDTLSKHVAESPNAYLGVSSRVIDSLRNPTNLREQLYSVCKTGHETALRIPGRWSDVVALFMVFLWRTHWRRIRGKILLLTALVRSAPH